MTKAKRTERVTPLDRVFLHHEKPRHDPYETQGQVIDYLCSSEEVVQLARDIAQHGLSPFDRFGVIKDHDTEGDDATYTAAEGNCRLCALKLITDPELAPPERKSFFEAQAAAWSPITQIPCVVIEDQDDLDHWLKRRHHGYAGGIGQKPWNADQKARHSGANQQKNEQSQKYHTAKDQRPHGDLVRYLLEALFAQTEWAVERRDLSHERREHVGALLAHRLMSLPSQLNSE